MGAGHARENRAHGALPQIDRDGSFLGIQPIKKAGINAGLSISAESLALFAQLGHLPFEQRRVRVEQALDAAGALGAGDGADARPLAQGGILSDCLLYTSDAADE